MRLVSTGVLLTGLMTGARAEVAQDSVRVLPVISDTFERASSFVDTTSQLKIPAEKVQTRKAKISWGDEDIYPSNKEFIPLDEIKEGANNFDPDKVKKSTGGFLGPIVDSFKAMRSGIVHAFDSVANLFNRFGHFVSNLFNLVDNPVKTIAQSAQENPEEVDKLAESGLKSAARVVNDADNRDELASIVNTLADVTIDDLRDHPDRYREAAVPFLNSGMEMLNTEEGQATATKIVQAALGRPETQETLKDVARQILDSPVADEAQAGIGAKSGKQGYIVIKEGKITVEFRDKKDAKSETTLSSLAKRALGKSSPELRELLGNFRIEGLSLF